jgi:hypothetical protein
MMHYGYIHNGCYLCLSLLGKFQHHLKSLLQFFGFIQGCQGTLTDFAFEILLKLFYEFALKPQISILKYGKLALKKFD